MEIYNENVYDLLDAPPDKTKNEPRKVCKLKEHNGQVHVKGLRELQVRSVDEARQDAGTESALMPKVSLRLIFRFP